MSMINNHIGWWGNVSYEHINHIYTEMIDIENTLK